MDSIGSAPAHNPRSIAIELITAILLAGPIGYLVHDRRSSVVTYLALWAAVFPIQTISVSHEGHLVSLYWVVNALILCLGLAANHQGARLRRARHQRVAGQRFQPNRLTAATDRPPDAAPHGTALHDKPLP
jgi:hypothetical protein